MFTSAIEDLACAPRVPATEPTEVVPAGPARRVPKTEASRLGALLAMQIKTLAAGFPVTDGAPRRSCRSS